MHAAMCWHAMSHGDKPPIVLRWSLLDVVQVSPWLADLEHTCEALRYKLRIKGHVQVLHPVWTITVQTGNT